jgi:hypothetical protein
MDPVAFSGHHLALGDRERPAPEGTEGERRGPSYTDPTRENERDD